jgi:hypothetical protein
MFNIKINNMHRRQISFDPRFLAQASPERMRNIKASLVEGKFDKTLFDLSDVM